MRMRTRSPVSTGSRTLSLMKKASAFLFPFLIPVVLELVIDSFARLSRRIRRCLSDGEVEIAIVSVFSSSFFYILYMFWRRNGKRAWHGEFEKCVLGHLDLELATRDCILDEEYGSSSYNRRDPWEEDQQSGTAAGK